MASISNESGRRIIQFVGDDQKRRSVRLGKCDQRTAEGVRLHVERLLESKATGMPVHIETSRWLGGIADELHERLEHAQLVAAREQNSAHLLPLSKMLDRYIQRRLGDMKPWSSKCSSNVGTSLWASLARVNPSQRSPRPTRWISNGRWRKSTPLLTSPN